MAKDRSAKQRVASVAGDVPDPAVADSPRSSLHSDLDGSGGGCTDHFKHGTSISLRLVGNRDRDPV
jgi:hypothetical protein